MSRAATTATTAISPRGRTSSSTGSSSPSCPTPWPISRASACTACRPAATACATSPPTSGPASRPTRSRTRASGPRSCASISTLHPEFSFLPRKFKIAVTAAGARPRGRAGARHRRCGCIATAPARPASRSIVGGGLGRTPFIGKTIKPFLPKRDLLSYVEAILRVYNQFGRRDNIYKARIKILVHELGAEAFAKEVEAEWQPIKDGALALDPAVIADIAARFRYPDYETLDDSPPELAQARARRSRASPPGSAIRSPITRCPATPS